MARKAILAELKTSYWRYSVKVMRELEIEMTQSDLFSLVGMQV